MHNRSLFALLLFPLLVCAPGCALFAGGASNAAGDPTPEIQALLAAQAAAWNRGDIEAFMVGYEQSEALLFTSGSNVRRGYEATLKKYRRSYVDADAMGTLAFRLLDVRPLGAQAAVVLGEWELTDTPRSAGGVFSLVLVRTPEGWRIVHDHTSARDE